MQVTQHLVGGGVAATPPLVRKDRFNSRRSMGSWAAERASGSDAWRVWCIQSLSHSCRGHSQLQMPLPGARKSCLPASTCPLAPTDHPQPAAPPPHQCSAHPTCTSLFPHGEKTATSVSGGGEVLPWKSEKGPAGLASGIRWMMAAVPNSVSNAEHPSRPAPQRKGGLTPK